MLKDMRREFVKLAATYGGHGFYLKEPDLAVINVSHLDESTSLYNSVGVAVALTPYEIEVVYFLGLRDGREMEYA